jgi:hypothetical protein
MRSLLIALALISTLEASYTDKRYYFVTTGTQARVYRSADFDYVLKVLRAPRARKKHLSFKGVLRGAERRSLKKIKAFQSYFISATQLAEETGLIDLHLLPGGTFSQKIWLVDERTLPCYLDLKKSAFLVQKYARSFSECLDEALEQERPDLALSMVEEALKVMRRVVEKGYLLADPQLLSNWGMTNEGPIIIDAGEFIRMPRSGHKGKIKLMFEKALFPLYLDYPALSNGLDRLMRLYSPCWEAN